MRITLAIGPAPVDVANVIFLFRLAIDGRSNTMTSRSLDLSTAVVFSAKVLVAHELVILIVQFMRSVVPHTSVCEPGSVSGFVISLLSVVRVMVSPIWGHLVRIALFLETVALHFPLWHTRWREITRLQRWIHTRGSVTKVTNLNAIESSRTW